MDGDMNDILQKFNNILEEKYNLNVVNETWSNGKLVKNEVKTQFVTWIGEKALPVAKELASV